MNCLTVPGVHPGSPGRPRGQIQVIFGPMFSGKSTELMRRVRRFQLAQYRGPVMCEVRQGHALLHHRRLHT